MPISHLEMAIAVLASGDHFLGMVEDLPPQQRDGKQAPRSVKRLSA